MSEGRKTYEELLLIAKEKFSPEGHHFFPPATRQAVHTIDFAKALGFTTTAGSTTSERHDGAVRFLQEYGVDGFSPSIALFGHFNGNATVKALPWTDFTVSHRVLIDDIRRQAEMTPVQPELLVGYAFRSTEGIVTSMYHGDVIHRNAVTFDEAAINALYAVAYSMPRVEHILATSGQFEPIGQ